MVPARHQQKPPLISVVILGGFGSMSFVSNATGGTGTWPSSTNYRYIDDVAWGTSRIGCN